MAKNTSIILGDHFDRFIQNEIKSGRYASVSEIIRSGLRILENEKKKIDAINMALKEGEASGKARLFNNEDFKTKMRNKIKSNE